MGKKKRNALTKVQRKQRAGFVRAMLSDGATRAAAQRASKEQFGIAITWSTVCKIAEEVAAATAQPGSTIGSAGRVLVAEPAMEFGTERREVTSPELTPMLAALVRTMRREGVVRITITETGDVAVTRRERL